MLTININWNFINGDIRLMSVTTIPTAGIADDVEQR